MNRRDLATQIGAEQDLSTDVVDGVLTSLFENITLALANGQEVRLMNFGKFEPRQRDVAKRRNPRTGESVIVPPRVGVGFKPSTTLKAKINGN